MATPAVFSFIAMTQFFNRGVLLSFGAGAFFGYFGLLVFLELYESQRPRPDSEDRRGIQKMINRCALLGAFVIGLISLALYLSR